MNTPESSGRTHVYRIGRGQKLFCLIFMAFALTFLVAVLWGLIFGDKEADAWTILAGFVLVVGGALITAEMFTTGVTLTRAEIRLGSVFGEKKLPFDKIRGRRRYFDPGTDEFPGEWRLKIVSDDDRFPSLDVEEGYRLDEAFRTWFNQLPDLDEADKTAPKTSNFGLV